MMSATSRRKQKAPKRLSDASDSENTPTGNNLPINKGLPSLDSHVCGFCCTQFFSLEAFVAHKAACAQKWPGLDKSTHADPHTSPDLMDYSNNNTKTGPQDLRSKNGTSHLGSSPDSSGGTTGSEESSTELPAKKRARLECDSRSDMDEALEPIMNPSMTMDPKLVAQLAKSDTERSSSFVEQQLLNDTSSNEIMQQLMSAEKAGDSEGVQEALRALQRQQMIQFQMIRQLCSKSGRPDENMQPSDEKKEFDNNGLFRHRSEPYPTSMGVPSLLDRLNGIKREMSDPNDQSYLSGNPQTGTEEPTEIKCERCNETFNSLGRFDWHSLSEHGDINCELCNEKFEDQRMLGQHMISHNLSSQLRQSRSKSAEPRVILEDNEEEDEKLSNSCGRLSVPLFLDLDKWEGLVDGQEGSDASSIRANDPYATPFSDVSHASTPRLQMGVNGERPLDLSTTTTPFEWKGQEFDYKSLASSLFPSMAPLNHHLGPPSMGGGGGPPGYFPPHLLSDFSPRPKKDLSEDDWESMMEISQTDEAEKIRQLVGDRPQPPTTDPNQCLVCRRILSCKSALQMHYRTHTGERPFKCKICLRAFTTKGNLKTHMGVHRSKHPFRLHHQCPICQKRFTNAILLQQHVRLHTSQLAQQRPPPPSLNPHPPSRSQSTSSLAAALSANMEMAGLAPLTPRGNEENNGESENRAMPSFSSALGLPTFGQPSTSGAPHTPHSGEGFNFGLQLPVTSSSSSELLNQLSGRSSPPPKYQPTSSPSVSSAASLLRQALPNMSPNPFSQVMMQSSGGYPPSPYQPNSKSLGGRQNTTCNICFKTFACYSALEIHYRSHTKERPFKCNICGRGFSTRGNMKQHLLTHKIRDSGSGSETHSNGSASATHTTSPMTGNSGRNGTELTFEEHLENLCDRSASQNSAEKPDDKPIAPEVNGNGMGPSPLESIQKMWAKTEPPTQKKTPVLSRHQCGVCFKHFSSSSALQIHMRTHTGDKPFKCTCCGRAFTTKGNLKVHMGTHMWNNPADSASHFSRRGRRIFDFPSPFMSPTGMPTMGPGGMPPPPHGTLSQQLSGEMRSYEEQMKALASPTSTSSQSVSEPEGRSTSVLVTTKPIDSSNSLGGPTPSSSSQVSFTAAGLATSSVATSNNNPHTQQRGGLFSELSQFGIGSGSAQSTTSATASNPSMTSPSTSVPGGGGPNHPSASHFFGAQLGMPNPFMPPGAFGGGSPAGLPPFMPHPPPASSMESPSQSMPPPFMPPMNSPVLSGSQPVSAPLGSPQSGNPMEAMLWLWRNVCSVCQKVCASPSELEEHLKLHLQPPGSERRIAENNTAVV